jgi:hypothetical protein
MPAEASVEVRLAELRAAYVAGLPAMLERFRGSVARLAEAEDPTARGELRDIAHRLAGTGALYGLAQLTAWGRASEKVVQTGALPELQDAAQALAFIVAQLR